MPSLSRPVGSLLLSLVMLAGFDPNAPFQADQPVPWQEKVEWSSGLGVSYFMGVDGIAVLRALRSDRRGGVSVPVLVLTADDDTEIMRSALDAGAEDFLAKPFDLNEVLFRVRKLLESGQRTGPQ